MLVDDAVLMKFESVLFPPIAMLPSVSSYIISTVVSPESAPIILGNLLLMH